MKTSQIAFYREGFEVVLFMVNSGSREYFSPATGLER
jgi:hypothetical protein